jgi:hypothetical protein
MIESALRSVGVAINALQDYIGHDAFKLFKLHGSDHWGREVQVEIPDIANLNVWQVAYQLIGQAEKLKFGDRFHIVEEYPIGKIDGIPLFPAIAIPVETKSTFECPPDHLECLLKHLDGLECLLKHLDGVDRIIIVGWRATENHFLEMLKDKLGGDIPVQVIAGDQQFAEEILERMRRAGIRAIGNAVDGGFTEYVVDREAERFLRRT